MPILKMHAHFEKSKKLRFFFLTLHIYDDVQKVCGPTMKEKRYKGHSMYENILQVNIKTSIKKKVAILARHPWSRQPEKLPNPEITETLHTLLTIASINDSEKWKGMYITYY